MLIFNGIHRDGIEIAIYEYRACSAWRKIVPFVVQMFAAGMGRNLGGYI